MSVSGQESHMNSRPIESLTQRETEVLRLLDARLSTSEIAAILDVSPGAVERYASRIYRKLAIGTRRNGIAPEDESSGQS